MKKLLLFILSGLFLININAQTTANFEWARKTGGTGSDQGRSVAVDASGNVYTAGSFQGTVDFDPGAGTYTLVSLGSDDAYVTKFDAFGNFIWAKTFGGTLQDVAYDIDLDQNGNIYTTGHFENTVDFDPSASTYTITSLGLQDVFINKLDPSGNFIWTKVLGGANSNVPYSIDVDATGNVHTAGYFSGNIDLDPSASTYTINGLGGFDIFISKLDAFGNFLWGKSIAGTSNEIAYAITTDASGNVYTTGYYAGTVDFDPNAGSSPKTSSGNQPDVFISKLDASGNYVNAIGLVGNWTTNQGNSIKVNNTGEVYIGGAFDATIDFDPGTGTANLGTTAVGDVDIFIAKYDASLNYIWAKRIGSTSDESCLGIDLDASDNIYATGYFRGTVDFDPNAGVFNMGTAGSNATYFLKLNPLGNFIWARNIAAASGNSGNGIVVNSLNDVYTVGGFAGNVDFDPNTGTYTLTAVGSNDTYVHKMSQCIAYASPVNTTPIPNLTFCQNQATTLTATGTGTVNWFATSTSTAVLGTGLTFVTPTLSAGSFTYYASTTNTCGLASIRTPFTMTVNAMPSITVNSGSICAGNSFTINPSGANTYTFSNGSVVTPTSNTSYTVTGTGANGCVNSIGSVSSVTVNAVPVIAVNSGSICAGNNFTITPSGASTYTIEGGGAVKTPTASTTYTVIGRSAAGCTSSTFATSSVTVNARPIINVNSGSICIGNSFTITPSGANTYTIQGGSAVKTPTANATYTVTGTSIAGCSSTSFATSSVTVNSKPTIIVNGGSICSGSSFTIVPSGAITYSFSNGSVVSPNVSTTYTVTGTDINGCTNSIGSTLLVAVNPPITNLSVAASSTNICTGQSATVTVASSQNGIKYYLRDDVTNNIVVGPVNGTGGTLSFNTGTLTSNSTYNVYAESQSLGNKGLDFDGTNDVITTNITSSTTSSLTIEAWIFPRATTYKRIVSNYFANTAQSGEIILDTYNTTNNGRGLRLVVEGAGNTLHQLSIANVLTLNAWNHVAGTFSNGVTTIYVNGIAVGTNTAPFTSIPSCTNTTTIGEDPTIGAAEYFNGKMDEVRIWNTARTQTEIAGNMNNCLIGNEMGLKNYFKFSESAGSTVTDLVTGAIGNMSGMTPATAWVTGNVDCGGGVCNQEMTQLVTINVNATPTISVNSGSICSGNNFTITPSGASTYTIQGGSAIKTPTANTTYTVAGTSTAGCISSTFATSSVTVNTTPTIAVNSGSICAGNNFTITPSGASTYTIQGGSAIKTPTANATYTVTGTSASGCTSSTFVTSTVTVNALPVISVPSTTICAGSTATLTASGANTYTWNTGVNTSFITASPASNTSYTVTGTSLQGCLGNVATASITVGSAPSIALNNIAVCAGSSATLIASGVSTYTWNTGATTNSIVVSPTVNTTYSVSGNLVGCTTSASNVSNVTVNSLPTITVNSGSICSGSSFTITPSGASTYTIQGGNTIVNPTANATFTVIGTNTNGCVSSSFATSSVSVNATPTIAVNSGSICVGNNYTITPSGANTYTIQGGNTIVNPTANATYTVIGTSANGCVSSSFATSSVSVNAVPTITVNSGSICAGESFTISPSGANTYTIQGGNTIVNPTANATYTVIGTNADGCVSSSFATSIVSVNAVPTITVNSGSICEGESFTITPIGANTYTFSNGNIVNPLVSTNYTITGTGSNGCVNSFGAVSSVTVNATPAITVANGAICPGNSFTLSPSGASTYTYSSGSAVVSPTSTSSYSISGTSAAGCISSNPAVATVTVSNTLSVVINGANTVCDGQAINLTAGGATTYTWNTGATSSTIAPIPSTNTTYSVIGASGTCSNTAVITVTVNTLPTINATTSNTIICTGETATLTANGASSYTWSPTGTGSSISVSPNVTTTYTVTGTDANGCENNSTVTQDVSLCTGINNITTNNNAMTLFPNPSSSILTIQTIEEIKAVYIFNTLGDLVRTENTNTFSVEQLSSGIYMIHVKTEKGINTLRFIRE
jgi:hypothetical protein